MSLLDFTARSEKKFNDMPKRTIRVNTLVLTLAILFVSASNPAYSAMKDVSVSVGAMSWYNRYVPISRIAGADVPKSSYGFMYGPTIRAQHNNLYFAVTYLLSSDNYNLVVTDSPVSIHHAKANSSASRSDIDVVVGYLLPPTLNVHTGYKGIFVDDAISFASSGRTASAKRNETYNVATLGTGITIPFGKKIILFVNGDVLLGSFHNDVTYPAGYRRLSEPVDDSIAWGVSADTRAVITIHNHLSANIGLKAQYIKAGSDNSSFLGPTVDIEYRF